MFLSSSLPRLGGAVSRWTGHRTSKQSESILTYSSVSFMLSEKPVPVDAASTRTSLPSLIDG